jgi:hypothetical protein
LILIVAHEVTNGGTDRRQLAKQAKSVIATESLTAVSDRELVVTRGSACGRKQLYVEVKYWFGELSLLGGKLLFRILTRIYLFVPNLCHASYHLLALTGDYWHIRVGQTPQVTD